MKIGVLDIQGSVEEHLESLKKLAKSGMKIEPILVKTPEALAQVSGLIIPGGESTTIGKLLRRFGLRDLIIERAKNGMAVWGTCAGAILLAKKIVGKQQADSLELMDIEVERNAYGRQLDSFETQLEFDLGSVGKSYAGPGIPGVFIRAPKIVSVGEGVKILAQHKGEIVAARQKNLLVTNFHPELSDNLEVHKYFVGMCEKKV
ncbi:MAG: pyridoxal 5'-phosphate synthase glutaminase subunit PdxT [Candidatus Peregrinibacteria bacterium]|nr:pyridoxal 5'-phosphate synthase glutaminase subunit PdxT [Candidatus Peregrinibacteria bacterium]